MWGQRFSTTLTTLCADRNSMLAAMFSGRYELTRDQKGHVFIDRDGTYFGQILNWLRNQQLPHSLPRHVLEAVLLEAEYYQLTGAQKFLDDLLEPDQAKRRTEDDDLEE